jgi:hypothetical protein
VESFQRANDGNHAARLFFGVYPLRARTVDATGRPRRLTANVEYDSALLEHLSASLQGRLFGKTKTPVAKRVGRNIQYPPNLAIPYTNRMIARNNSAIFVFTPDMPTAHATSLANNIVNLFSYLKAPRAA